MSSIDVAINKLNTAAWIVVLVIPLISFVPGVVGLIFNVLVFTRPTLRREPCALYFFSSTCFNLFVEFIVLPVRILSNGFAIDMAFKNLAICKIEYYSFYTVRAISCWLIAFACVDRYLHSSANVHIRRMSSVKIARVLIGITTIAMFILYSHMLVYYEISYATDQFGKIVPSCNGQKGIYRTFIAFWHMVFYSLCPCFLMLLFGSLTLNNIRQRRRVLSLVGEGNRFIRRTDTHLLRMLAAQMLIIIISTLPHSIYRLYASFTSNMPRNSLRIAQENLIFQTVNTIAYFAHTSSFYLYTLTGDVFRKEVIKIVAGCLPHHRNHIRMFHVRTNQITVLQRYPQIPVIHHASTQQ
ncbi:unnamed protein product [Rotaria sp. Silwood1]|nr:unnamed protein product [Rotaria sp. Silwood1]